MMSKEQELPTYTKSQYDSVAYRANRQQEIIDELRAEVAGLSEALMRQSLDKAKEAEGEAVIRERNMITQFVVDATKLRPRSIKIKYRGSTVVEIECLQDRNLNGEHHEVSK